MLTRTDIIVLVLGTILLVSSFMIVIWLANHDKTTVNNQQENRGNVPKAVYQANTDRRPENYITPADFSVGLIAKDRFESMNECNKGVLYPINSVKIDYGGPSPGMPDTPDTPVSRCTEFIQPP